MDIKQHEREANLAQAQAKLAESITEISKACGLTTVEVVASLSQIQARWSKYLLLDEREAKS